MDIQFDQQLKKLFDSASEKKLWRGTTAARDRAEFWWREWRRTSMLPGPGKPRTLATDPLPTREALKAYDPDLYALVDETMAYKEHVDWRFNGDLHFPASKGDLKH